VRGKGSLFYYNMFIADQHNRSEGRID
jgi:hypothetical protein